MQHQLLHEAAGQHGPQRTFAVVLETGDEVMACLKDFIAQENIRAAQITAIGALSNVVLNYFDSRSTNASAESFNAKLKGFRALLRGVRDKPFFFFRVSKLYG